MAPSYGLFFYNRNTLILIDLVLLGSSNHAYFFIQIVSNTLSNNCGRDFTVAPSIFLP